MPKRGILAFAALFLLPVIAQTPVDDAPAYAADGNLKIPASYREWVFLSSGLDMSYTATQAPTTHLFDNTFVNRSSYKAFVATGKWPDGTTIVLESRGADSPISINKQGHTQSAKVQGLEYHVRDHGKWEFYRVSDNSGNARKLPDAAGCKACHEGHGAVDATFVQFYPTLMPIAEQKKTLSEVYLREMAVPVR